MIIKWITSREKCRKPCFLPRLQHCVVSVFVGKELRLHRCMICRHFGNHCIVVRNECFPEGAETTAVLAVIPLPSSVLRSKFGFLPGKPKSICRPYERGKCMRKCSWQFNRFCKSSAMWQSWVNSFTSMIILVAKRIFKRLTWRWRRLGRHTCVLLKPPPHVS